MAKPAGTTTCCGTVQHILKIKQGLVFLTLDANLPYQFHMYWTDPAQKTIERYLEFRDSHNVPVWLGESGENTDERIGKFARLLEANDAGWCYRPYKKRQLPRQQGEPGATPTRRNEYAVGTPAVRGQALRFPGRPDVGHRRSTYVQRRPARLYSRLNPCDSSQLVVENLECGVCRCLSGPETGSGSATIFPPT